MNKQFIQSLIGRGLFVASMALIALGAFNHSQVFAAPMAVTSGLNYAGSAAQAVATWSDPANSTGAPDNNCSIGLFTAAINLTNFGFAIPSGSTITGILVEPQASVLISDAPNSADAAQLLKSGLTAGVAKTSWSPVSGSCALSAFSSLGGTGDMWGTTWTASDINSHNFGVQLTNSANPTPINLDAVRITVYYDPVAAAPSEVPESDTLLLLGGGMSGLGLWLRWQWSKRKQAK